MAEHTKSPPTQENEQIGSEATLKADSSDSLPGAAQEDLANSDTEMGDPPASVEEQDSQDLTGQVLAERYTVLEKIGSGGMSVVYLARHELLKKLVAIKVLRADQALRKDSKARFHREARAAASIGDPHIVDITDYGFTDKGDAFIVMERLEGRDLRATVTAEGPLPSGRAVAISRQILRALISAHESGIIHRDLKAENVFLCQRDGKDFVKLLDFGISKVTRPMDADEEGDAGGLTSTGQVLGTPQYLAPEQAHGIEHVDHRADIYAMGVMLYEMLTGELPFTGRSVFEVVMKHVQEPPQPPRERRPDLEIPAELERVVLRALAKEPEQRHQSAREMLDSLPSAQELPGGYTSQSITPAPEAARPRRPWAAIAAAGVLTTVVVGWLVLRQGDSSKPALPAPTVVEPGPPDLRLPDTGAPAARPDTAAMVTLEVRATPSRARILVNGKDVGTGHGVTALRPGSRAVVEVSAPGHRPHHEVLTVEKNLVLPVRLRRGRHSPPSQTQTKGTNDLQQNPYR